MSEQAMEVAFTAWYKLYGDGYSLHQSYLAWKAACKWQREQDTWKNVVLDQCMVAHSAFYEDDAKKTLDTLIDWHVKIALDPSVSSDAQALIASAPHYKGEL